MCEREREREKEKEKEREREKEIERERERERDREREEREREREREMLICIICIKMYPDICEYIDTEHSKSSDRSIGSEKDPTDLPTDQQADSRREVPLAILLTSIQN